MRRSLALSLLLLHTGCRFDGDLPPGANVSCRQNAECPRGFGCRQPAGRCESAFTNDSQAPGAESVVVTYEVAGLPDRSALGPAGVTTVQLELTEPISNIPALEAGAGVTCDGPTWRNATLSWACRAATDATEGAHALSLRLVDLASNEASLTLPQALAVDVTPPATLGPLAITSTPYATPPFFGITLEAGRVLPGHLVVTLTADAGVRDVATATDAGVSLLIDLTAVRHVTEVDEAGNRAPPSTLERVLESLTGPLSPHTAWRTSSLGPSLTHAQDWSVLTTASGRLPAGVSWVHHRDAVPADATLVFTHAIGTGELLAIDGASNVWRLGPGGFAPRDVSQGLLGLPPFATDSAWGYDRKGEQLVRVGGAVGPSELTNAVWRLADDSWRRTALPNDPLPAIRGSALEWSSAGLALFGGRLRDGSLTDEVWRFTGDDFERTTVRLPAPRVHLATTFETETSSTWLFGGEGPQGATNTLWRWSGDGGLEVVPQRQPWPPAGGVVALSATPDGLLLAHAASGTVSVWQLRDGGFDRRGSAPLPGTDVALAFDVSSDALLARVVTGTTAELHWLELPSLGARRVHRDTAPPPRLLTGASFTGAAGGAVLFGGALDDGGLDDLPWRYSNGWLPLPRGPEARTDHAAWSHGDALYVMGGTGAAGPLTAAWVFDGGWSALPSWGLRDGSALGPAVGFHLDGPRVAAPRDVAGRAGLAVIDPSNDTVASRRFVPGARADQAVQGDGGVLLLASVGNTTQVVSLPSADVFVALAMPNRVGCYEPTLENLVSVGRADDGGLATIGTVGELVTLDGGRLASFAPLSLADTFGDLSPRLDATTLMTTFDGRCWLLRQGPVGVDTWELSTRSRPAVVLEVVPAAFGLTKGHRSLHVRVDVDGGVGCFAHVDGRWRQTSSGGECVFDERLFTFAAGVWRTAVTLPLQGQRATPQATLQSVTLETTLE